jgi:hypothetical protein
MFFFLLLFVHMFLTLAATDAVTASARYMKSHARMQSWQPVGILEERR